MTGIGNAYHGLTGEEAAARLRVQGANELPSAGRRSILHIILEVAREPMLVLLLAGGLIYLLLGDRTEAILLMLLATLSVAITVIQESRAEGVLEALRDLSSPRALVIRDGAQVRIAGREVVHGDLLVLEHGDRVAADAVLLEALDLQTDESLLTGESLPVGKAAATPDTEDAENPRPGGEGQSRVYSGSLVVRGSGIARVTATGPTTEIGKIGQSLATLDTESPRLRRETQRIVAWAAAGGSLVAVAVVVLYGLQRGEWLDALLAGIAVSMSLLPEEFPVVLSVFLAMGAWRIGKAGVLTRRAAAIETLGSATVLCTDKTGTLTENRMALEEIWLPGEGVSAIGDATRLSDAGRALVRSAALASAVQATDPMDIALHAAHQSIAGEQHPSDTLLYTWGLRPELLAMSNAWEDGETVTISAKGAPEAIAELCRLSPERVEQMRQAMEDMATRGSRVLAVATATAPDRDWRESQQSYAYTLAGLVGLADPVRASVPDAIAECRRAGVRVVMITGDYAATARTIATQAGIPGDNVLTGSEMDELDDDQLARRMDTTSVFARIMPEQKLRIVQAFKRHGEVVAMTGDGVNDAPSLKAAHIGVAMGKRGTDVAREAADIVLLDDDFGSIVESLGLGRRIYDNLRKAMGFIFAVHVPIAGLALLPLLLGMPMLLGPIHIVLLELVIDPICALVFEAERAEDDIMDRPPRDPAERLFSLPMIAWSLFQGAVAFAMLAAVFLYNTRAGMPVVELRALVFFALIAEVVALVLVNRSFTMSLVDAFTRRNPALRWVVLAVAAVTALILFVPPVQRLLRFGSITTADMLLALAMGMVLLLVLELCKPLIQRIVRRIPATARAR